VVVAETPCGEMSHGGGGGGGRFTMGT